MYYRCKYLKIEPSYLHEPLWGKKLTQKSIKIFPRPNLSDNGQILNFSSKLTNSGKK